MRSVKLAMVLTALASSFAFGQSDERPDDHREILSSITEISRAYVARDPETFERLYLENYASIRGKPIYNLREQLVAMMRADSVIIRAGKKPEFETLIYESESPRITLYDRVAVVNVSKKNLWQYRRQKCLTRTLATEVWVKPENEWKIAASHTTTFQCEPKPFYPLHSAVSAIQSKSRAPANTDLAAEREIRESIRVLTAARASIDEPFDAVVDRHIANRFVSVDEDGRIGPDRGIFSDIQMPMPSRSLGIRSQEDALLIYGNAAVYTFRIRGGTDANPDGPQQCTIVFVRTGDGWRVAAAHKSKLSSD